MDSEGGEGMKDDGPVCDSVLRCKKWEKNVPELDGIIFMALWHGLVYKGDFFEFCPWCGKELTWANKEGKR